MNKPQQITCVFDSIPSLPLYTGDRGMKGELKKKKRIKQLMLIYK